MMQGTTLIPCLQNADSMNFGKDYFLIYVPLRTLAVCWRTEFISTLFTVSQTCNAKTGRTRLASG